MAIYRINDAGMALIKSREGLELHSYPDLSSPLAKACREGLLDPRQYKQLHDWENYSGKPWTIGYGETKAVGPDITITALQAEAELEQRVSDFCDEVQNICKILQFTPTPNQLAAIVCFVYNLGIDNFLKLGTTVRLSDDYPHSVSDFAVRMLQYCHADGNFIKGLYNRRKEEAALFLKI